MNIRAKPQPKDPISGLHTRMEEIHLRDPTMPKSVSATIRLFTKYFIEPETAFRVAGFGSARFKLRDYRFESAQKTAAIREFKSDLALLEETVIAEKSACISKVEKIDRLALLSDKYKRLPLYPGMAYTLVSFLENALKCASALQMAANIFMGAIATLLGYAVYKRMKKTAYTAKNCSDSIKRDVGFVDETLDELRAVPAVLGSRPKIRQKEDAAA